MPQLFRPATTIKVVPKDGELEITLNINITVDGQMIASASSDNVSALSVKQEEDKVELMIPDFSSGFKVENFGK